MQSHIATEESASGVFCERKTVHVAKECARERTANAKQLKGGEQKRLTPAKEGNNKT